MLDQAKINNLISRLISKTLSNEIHWNTADDLFVRTPFGVHEPEFFAEYKGERLRLYKAERPSKLSSSGLSALIFLAVTRVTLEILDSNGQVKLQVPAVSILDDLYVAVKNSFMVDANRLIDKLMED